MGQFPQDGNFAYILDFFKFMCICLTYAFQEKIICSSTRDIEDLTNLSLYTTLAASDLWKGFKELYYIFLET